MSRSNSKPKTEYEQVQAQILERKAELRHNGFPEQMYELWSTLRMFPRWAAHGFNSPMHPELTDLNVTSTDRVNFNFKGISYAIDFHQGRSNYGYVPGNLTISSNDIDVMNASFSAVDGSSGLERFTYRDSSLYKKAPWVEDLARLQTEFLLLREATKKRQIEGPENLDALREQFGISALLSPIQNQPLKTARSWRKLFRR